MTDRIVALDVGDRRIGIAISDPGRTIASPYSVYERKGWGPDVRQIAALCESFGTHDILLGLPYNMDGSEGGQAGKVREFAQKLSDAGLNVLWQDERLTTVTAQNALIEGGMRREKRRQTVDKVAAAIILQQYLDTLAYQQEELKMANDIEKVIPETEEEESNIVELTDEDGVTSQFEYVMTVEHEGNNYVVLMVNGDEADSQKAEDEDEGEVVILQIKQDDAGEDIYVSVEEDVSQAVFDKFMQLIDEEDAEETEGD